MVRTFDFACEHAFHAIEQSGFRCAVEPEDVDLVGENIEQLGRRLARDEFALVDDADAVAQFLRDMHVVRGHEDALALVTGHLDEQIGRAHV